MSVASSVTTQQAADSGRYDSIQARPAPDLSDVRSDDRV